MIKKKLLIVEDEKEIASLIVQRFDTKLYDVDVAVDGNEGLLMMRTKKYDLATIDIMLPKLDGLSLCKEFRRHSSKTILILLSALDEEDMRLKGYDVGADDYVTKPFSVKELVAKVEAFFKRSDRLLMKEALHVNNLLLDDESKAIRVNGFELNLTPSEYLLLYSLIRNPKKLFSRDELSYLIYEHDLGVIDSHGIASHIYNIRKKIKKIDSNDYVKTVHGQGYILHEY